MRARRPTRDTSRVGTGRESGTLGDPRAPHVAAGESRRDRRGTPAPPTPLCEACPARRRLAASPLRRHPPIERCAPGAYPACRAGFASRGTAVARGIVPSRSRLAPTRDMSLGSRSCDALAARNRASMRAERGQRGIGIGGGEEGGPQLRRPQQRGDVGQDAQVIGGRAGWRQHQGDRGDGDGRDRLVEPGTRDRQRDDGLTKSGEPRMRHADADVEQRRRGLVLAGHDGAHGVVTHLGVERAGRDQAVDESRHRRPERAPWRRDVHQLGTETGEKAHRHSQPGSISGGSMRPEYCTGGAFSSRSPGGVKRGPMLRPLAVAIALAALAACARPGPARSPTPVMPPGTARIAVVPFRTAGAPGAEAGGGGEGVPADAGPAAARMLAAHLAETGMAVVDADRVLGAWSLADTTAYDPRVAAHVAEKVGANLAVLGTLSRYRERQGTAWAVEAPAAVAYEAAVVHAPDGALLAVDRFEYAQQALTENLLQLPRFVESGGRWLSREELLDQALARTAQRLARALGAPPVRR